MVHPDMIAIAVLKELGVPPAGHKINIIAAALRAYGAECAAQERERTKKEAASVAACYLLDEPSAPHAAKTLVHSVAQIIAGLIMDLT